jgi:hypothetical protein
MAWIGSIAIGGGSREIIECMPDGKIVNVPDFGESQTTAGYRLRADGSGTCVIRGMAARTGTPRSAAGSTSSCSTAWSARITRRA